jgi:hypothetical protein
MNFTTERMDEDDINEILEYVKPKSYEEFAGFILKNSMYDKSYYNKNMELFNYIIKYLILSYKIKDKNFFDEKCKLLEFIVDCEN